MGLWTKLAIVALAVILAILVYMATVGVAVYREDFDTDVDGDGANDAIPEKDIIAYAWFEIKTAAWLYDTTKVDGYALSIGVNIRAFESYDTNRIYDLDKWDILSPVPPSSETILGECWIVVKVTGPGGYISTWTSERSILLSSTYYPQDPSYVIYGTGNSYFVDTGQYKVTATQYAVLFSQNLVTEEGTKSADFTVSSDTIYGG